jgi:RNA polymerase sigma-70 factor, ECF subfamily
MATLRDGELADLRPRMLAFALRRSRSREQAEDAVQEALAAALEGLERYSGEASLATWLFGILKHKIVDSYRGAPAEEPLEYHEQELLYEGPGPEQACAGRAALRRVERRLAELPAKSAQAFILREALGMDTPEVCRELRITPGHCWVLVHRARKRLRALPEAA